MIHLKSIKIQLALFLTGFALYLALLEKEASFLLSLSMAVICTVGAESLALVLKQKKLSISESSIVTGLIIGFVLSSDQPPWVLALTAGAAISSKHLIRINGRHLFNPAGFGLLLAAIVCGAQMQWKGTFVWPVMVLAGLYFAYRVRKLEILAGYFLISWFLFGSQAFLSGFSLRQMFGYFSYFYIFVMLIEPKTSPVTGPGKFLFGAGVAGLIFILTQAGVRFDAELGSLLLANLAVPGLNQWVRIRGKGGNT